MPRSAAIQAFVAEITASFCYPETYVKRKKAMQQQNSAIRILKNIAALLIGQVTTNVLSLVVAVYIPRRLGPLAMGEMTVAAILTTLVSTVLTLGISTVLVRDIARDQRKASDLLGAAMAIRMLMALPSLALVAGIVWVVGYAPEVQMLIAINAVTMVIGMLMTPFQSGFQAFERMKYNSLTGVISEIIYAFAGIAIVFAGGGVMLLCLLGLFTAVVVLFLNVKWWRSLGNVHLHIDWKLIRYLVIGGLPFWVTGLFYSIYLYVDSFMLSVMTNEEVVGWYAIPTNLFGLLLFIPNILSTAIFPSLARTYKTAPREMIKIARRSFNLITCISLPVAVGGMLLAKQVILTLYGLEFGPSIPVLTVLAASVVPTYLNMLINQFLIATERQVVWTKVMGIVCVINPLLNLALINFYQEHHLNGAFGAAWALLLTEGLQTVVGIALLPRGILGWSNVVSIGKSTAAAGLMTLGVWYTQAYFLPIPIATGFVVYVVSALLLGVLPREDLGMVQSIGTKVLNKVGIKRAVPQPDRRAA